MDILFDFKNKSNIHDVLDITYSTLNDLLGKEFIVRGRKDAEIWDAYYDDVFDIVTEREFLLKYGSVIKFILKDISVFKKAEPKNYKKFIEWVMDYQVENLPKYGKVNFSYEIKE